MLPGAVRPVVREGGGTLSTTVDAGLGRLETWFIKNSTWFALCIVAVAFALRVAYANSCYLNPDEAMHFDVARPGSWADAFKSSFSIAHPPLFILVLHGFLFLGRSELFLRLPSVLGGTAALCFAYVWIRRSLGEIPALAGLGFLALSPAAVSASTEVRQYGLLLFFVCGALYATERIFAERSVRWTLVQAIFLLGAILTNYPAVVVLVSLGIYVLLRLLTEDLPRSVFITFCAGQFVVASTLAWLYLAHVRGSIPFGSGSSMAYLRHYYYSAASESWLEFSRRSIFRTFSYTTGNRLLAVLLMLAFAAGIVALLNHKVKSPRLMALLILSPFVLGFALAIFQVLPFAGTRHQTYLLPFLAAGIGAAFASLRRGWAVPLLLLGVLVAPVWARRAPPDNNPRIMPKSDMTAALEYTRGAVPLGSSLFVDTETREQLEYYWGKNDKSLDALRFELGRQEQLGGYRVIVAAASYLSPLMQDPRLATVDFALHPDAALAEVNDSARVAGLQTGNPLWIFSVASWKSPPLASQLPTAIDHDAKEFGEISVIRVLEL
jgi:4-amino-4-deoxy-L-arabinose transferase-like glycosyltransferase